MEHYNCFDTLMKYGGVYYTGNRQFVCWWNLFLKLLPQFPRHFTIHMYSRLMCLKYISRGYMHWFQSFVSFFKFLNFGLLLYTNVDQKLLNSLCGLLNCEIDDISNIDFATTVPTVLFTRNCFWSWLNLLGPFLVRI